MRSLPHFSSSSSIPFSLLLSLLLFSSVVLSQRCTLSHENVPSECEPLLFTSYFLPPASYNITKEDIDKEATIAALSVSIFEDSCRVHAMKFACSVAYRPCEFNEISPSLPNFLVFPLPRSPSNSLCRKMVAHCTGVLPETSLPNCTSLETDGQPTYPNKTTTYIVNGNTYQVPVNDYPEDHDLGTTTLCPLPFELRDDGKADPPCQYPCPNPLWTDEQHEISYIITDIGGATTFLTGTWIVICWLAQERLRKFPANLPVFPAAAAAFAGVVVTISSIIEHKNIICKDNWTVGDSTGLCGVQGFFLAIAAMINVMYFFFICLNLFLVITLEVHMERFKWWPWTIHILGLGLPVVFAIIVYAAQVIDGGSIWCFTTFGDSPAAAGWVLATSYGWMGLFVIINLILVPILFGKLYMVRRRTGKTYKTSGMLTFVCLFEFVFGWGFSALVTWIIKMDDWTKGGEDYTVCHMQLRPHRECVDELITYPFWFGMWSNSLWLFAGVWIMLAFGATKQIHMMGLRFLKEVFFDGRWRLIMTGLPRDGSASRSRGRVSKAKTSKNQGTGTGTGTGTGSAGASGSPSPSLEG